MDAPETHPYLIFVCCDRSSALSIGDSSRSTVRNAARFAVYDEIMMRVKNHHIPATIRVDTALPVTHRSDPSSPPSPRPLDGMPPVPATHLGAMSDPCCMSDPQLCQKALDRVSSFSNSSGSSTHGYGFTHSYGVNLREA